MSTRISGSVRKATPNTVDAQRRSAESRRCPKCGRGSAKVSVTPRPTLAGEVTTYCRWDDCNWARVVPDYSHPLDHDCEDWAAFRPCSHNQHAEIVREE